MKFIKTFPKNDLAAIMLIAVIAVISWFPVFHTGFLNDDIQILSYHNPLSAADCFKPFHSEDVSGHFWRPAVNTMHNLTVYYFGMSPLAFRILYFILYLLASVLLYFSLRQMNFRILPSLFSAMLFALLPAHELAVAWTADAGSSLMLVFILAATMSYIKLSETENITFAIIAALFFLLAVLTKEHSWFAAFIPLILKVSGKKTYYWQRASAAAFVLIIFVQLIRLTAIGGNPFSSPNLVAFDVPVMIQNILFYIPLSVLSAEQLRSLMTLYQQNSMLFISLALMATAALIMYFFIMKNFKMTDKSAELKKTAIFAVLWFLTFIIPASTLLMRWYAFVPSAALAFLLAGILNTQNKQKQKIVFFIPLLLLFLYFAVYNHCRMLSWQKGAEIYTSVTANFPGNAENKSALYLWGVPDKIDHVNIMKTGTQQTVHYALGNSAPDVLSPLRFEAREDFEIFYEIGKNELLLIGENVTFYHDTGSLASTVKPAEYKYSEDKYSLEIYNGKDSSRAEIKFLAMPDDAMQLIFNGKTFITHAFQNL